MLARTIRPPVSPIDKKTTVVHRRPAPIPVPELRFPRVQKRWNGAEEAFSCFSTPPRLMLKARPRLSRTKKTVGLPFLLWSVPNLDPSVPRPLIKQGTSTFHCPHAFPQRRFLSRTMINPNNTPANSPACHHSYQGADHLSITQ